MLLDAQVMRPLRGGHGKPLRARVSRLQIKAIKQCTAQDIAILALSAPARPVLRRDIDRLPTQERLRAVQVRKRHMSDGWLQRRRWQRSPPRCHAGHNQLAAIQSRRGSLVQRDETAQLCRHCGAGRRHSERGAAHQVTPATIRSRRRGPGAARAMRCPCIDVQAWPAPEAAAPA